MLRTLFLTTLLFVSPHAAPSQTPSVLRIKVVVADAAGKPTPVPRYLLLVSDNPASASPRRVMTALDGTATVRLQPGNYTVESDQPFAFLGKTYEWTQVLDITAGRDAVLELTEANAEIVSADAPPTGAGSTATESAMLLARWQDSVVGIWTPTAHASGFTVDDRGLIATNQRDIGAATSVEVQITPQLKVGGEVIASDAEHGVAIVRIDANVAKAMRPVPLACGAGSPATAAERTVVAIGTTLRQQKRMSSGSTSGSAAHLNSSDLSLPPGSAGGPVFAMGGALIGLTTVFAQDGENEARVVPTADVCGAIAAAEKKMSGSGPAATNLPIEPSQPFPAAALQEGAKRRTASPAAYRMSSGDFDLAFITPVLNYGAQTGQDAARRPPPSGSSPLNPLENFSNWASYVADVPPVLMIRVTPKFVEGFWTRVARGAASTQGVSLPPIKRFKAGFARLRAYCGEAEVTPIHPFRLEQRLSETEAIYEGLYVFDPGALTPACGSVRLTLYSEKEPAKGDSRPVDPKLIQQIYDDFEPYRTQR